MDTKKLRQKILDLAIRGKLVPQDPNDEPASVLLDRIRAEKERLIAEGKIKRTKKGKTTSDASHYEKFDPPFEIPDSWEWTTLGRVGVWQSGGTPSRSNKSYYNGNIPWLKTGDLNDSLITNIPESISEEAVNNSSAKINPTGSVLMAMYGATIGKLGILTFPATTNQACCACIDFKGIIPLYLFYFLLSQRDNFIALGGGGAQPNISKEKIESAWVPIPPIKEQQRIVDAIKNAIVYIDTLEYQKEDIAKLICIAKSKILGLAISGKLVPQNSNDEPAIVALQRINPDFKPCDNPQYQQLPNGWTLAKIKDVYTINPRNKATDDTIAGFVPMANISNGYHSSFTFEPKKWSRVKNGFTHFQNGDIVVAKISPCLENRKSAIITGLPNNLGAGTTELHVFRQHEMNASYSLIFFKTDYFIKKCIGSFNGAVGQQRVNIKVIEDLYIPVPPIAEQGRIVKVIKSAFEQLDKIASALKD